MTDLVREKIREKIKSGEQQSPGRLHLDYSNPSSLSLPIKKTTLLGGVPRDRIRDSFNLCVAAV